MFTLNELSHKEVLYPSSLEEILEILSLEYEDDLKPLSKAPHQWLIVKDEETGVIGGLCLTPRASLPSHPMLADFCRNLKSDNGWVASHSFLWVPEYMEEGSKEEGEALSTFYKQLYTRFVEFCSSISISQVWIISLAEHHITASEIGLLPFKQEMPFQHQDNGYIAALLPASNEAMAIFRQSHALYNTSKYCMN
jgi:hypothetical protein